MLTRVERRVLAHRGDVMAYLVLVIGALMSLAGLYGILTGYPIIQIERGWATVIAGSTMFTGGLVTMAIGLVLRTLMRIAGAIETSPMALPSETATPVASARATPPDFEPLSNFDAVPDFETPMGVIPRRAPIAPFNIVSEPVITEQAFVAHPPELAALHADEDQGDLHGIDQSLDDRDVVAFDEDQLVPEPEGPPMDPPPHEPEPADEPDHLDHYELQTPSTPEHDLAPPVETAAPAKVEPTLRDDWLDHAFSSLDEELSLGPAQRHPEHDDIEHDQIEHDTVAYAPFVEAEHQSDHHSEDELAVQAHPDETEFQAVEATEWAPPEPEVAVIGRYESDGTTYIMFADGSIEAQSEAGIYRFRSMAELKAFIEG